MHSRFSFGHASEERARRWAHDNVSFTCRVCGQIVPGDGDLNHETFVDLVFGEANPRVSMGLCSVDYNRQKWEDMAERGLL